ncbi:MAG: SGNH/GDSL hydrolase family protein [Anaerolinea sp.]|nr:SGNH/GDSL hydrolase family protein [Anaerolinea sp.]MCC6974651.1 SGNH/GDSL hydrolase family protein [Anaerolineae bacterium]CAG0991452.1 Acetylxylan esterase [Anaerolineae bacterium]
MPLLLEPNKKLVFIGDSITDSGRRDAAPPYGNGYVSQVRTFLIARYPTLNLNIVNKGIGGNTVRDLAARWEIDVIAERPHYLSVCVGINDVWRQFSNDPTAVLPQEYQETYRRLLRRAVETGITKLILMSPYMIETNKLLPMRKKIEEYGGYVSALAREFNATFINLQEAWDRALRVTPPLLWTNDSFHVNAPGAAVIAQAFMRAVGYEV